MLFHILQKSYLLSINKLLLLDVDMNFILLNFAADSFIFLKVV